jgi:hypothetical protein
MAEHVASQPIGPDGDGRQSETARDIARGVGRCLQSYGLAVLSEVTLASGRRADVMAVSPRSEIWIIEIKSSIEDFRSDHKWQEYREACDRFFFAVKPEFPRDVLPTHTGLILADRYGGDVVRPADPHRLAAARRKSVLTLFAMTAAQRLSAAADPLFVREQRR